MEDENKAREAANDAWIFSLASGAWTKVEYTSVEVPRVRAWLYTAAAQSLMLPSDVETCSEEDASTAVLHKQLALM